MDKLNQAELVKCIKKLNSTIKSAHHRNKEFSLTLLYTNNLMKHTHCAYTGKPFVNEINHDDSMTFERIDNSIGYVDGNVIPVCASINHLRGSKTLLELQHQFNQAKENMMFASAHIDEVEELTYEQIVNRMYNNKDKKYDTIRSRVDSINKNRARLIGANNQLKALERKRNELNDPTYKEVFYQNNVKSAEKFSRLINSGEQVIKEFVERHYVKESKYAEKFKVYSKQVEDLDALIKGILKFENLTKKEKACLSFGIPLDSSYVVLLKTKLVYNLLGG